MAAADEIRYTTSTGGLLATLCCALSLAVGLAFPVRADSAAGLDIIVYGASGRVGSRVVTEALNRGHRVTAVSRDPERITTSHDNLSKVRGDILDIDSVESLIAGHDVVVVSVRGMSDDSKDPAKTVQRVGAEVLVEAMRSLGEGAPRMIYVGGAGSLEVAPGVLYADTIPRIAKLFMPRSAELEIQGHVLTLKYLRTVDDVAWTYISPPKRFGPGERTGHYRIGGDQMLIDENGRSAISMEDFAIAVVDEAESGRHVGQRFSVAY